jgi:hypothetical protein
MLLIVANGLQCRTYFIKNNTANVVRLDIVRDHFAPRQIKLNAYEPTSVTDIEDVFIQDGKQVPACSKQLNLIDSKTNNQLATMPFNDSCKNAEVRIDKDAKNNFKLEAKVK